MLRQFVLDGRTERLLNRLALTRDANRNVIVREAIELYASLQERLDAVESQPGFQRLMRQTAADIEADRVLRHAQVKKLVRKKR